jgi:eukaryotic-like serine/threonine-protein kinase
MPAAGTRLGPYEIVAQIGAGAMGEVYRARDTRIRRDVAIKILPEHFLSDPVRRARFAQEARAAGALNHPNVVAVYDVGENYIVTELIEGVSLRAFVRRGPVSLTKVLEIAAQIAAGLAAAHAARIVHRDLKPENVMLTRDGRVKILDFGLAKESLAAGPDDATLTLHSMLTDRGMVVGTVSYMSPEQIQARTVDHRCDIFSFGIILYELICGQRPFRGTSSVEIMNAILNEDVPAFPPNTPLQVERIVRRCLEKYPDRRFQSSSDLEFAVISLAQTRQLTTRKTQGHNSIVVRSAWLAAISAAVGLAFIAGLKSLRPEYVETPTVRYLTYSGHDSSPSVSPDGHTVAFVSSRDGKQRIWLKQLNAGSEVALTEGPDTGPRYSPDGSMLLFLRAEPTGLALYRTPAVAPEPRRLLHNVSSADWSADGRRIVYIRWETDSSTTHSVIGIVDANGNDHGAIAGHKTTD